jgi:hypothetical protein
VEFIIKTTIIQTTTYNYQGICGAINATVKQLVKEEATLKFHM